MRSIGHGQPQSSLLPAAEGQLPADQRRRPLTRPTRTADSWYTRNAILGAATHDFRPDGLRLVEGDVADRDAKLARSAHALFDSALCAQLLFPKNSLDKLNIATLPLL